MERKIIITCAVTGGADTPVRNPAVPVTPEQIARSSIDAHDAGAAVLHIHVRDPVAGRSSGDLHLFAEVVDRIRAERPNAILNLTTGTGGLMSADQLRKGAAKPHYVPTAEERMAQVMALQPELCSLDMGTMNFGDRIFVNPIPDLKIMAKRILEAGTIPELEVFDVGQMRTVQHLLDQGVLSSPLLIQLCLGILGGAPAEPEIMTLLAGMLPPAAIWTGFGIGSQQFPMVAQSVLLGGHVRVGLEDNLYLSRGVLAPSNAALVEKAVGIIRALDCAPASTIDARAMLGLSS